MDEDEDQRLFLLGVRAVPERLARRSGFPFDLAFVPDLDLTMGKPVTFFVGENGSGKSTLLEAIASLARLPVSGGSRNELSSSHGPDQVSALASVLRPVFRRRPKDGYFFRAEFHAHFASLLEERAVDPDFRDDPYKLYGGRSLHTRSHGESFLSLMERRIGSGLYLMDEPEAALSPQRQLTLLALMAQLVATVPCQFVIATHSPILLTYPDADIVSFDEPSLPRVRLEETSHYQITRQILSEPARFWRHLKNG